MHPFRLHHPARSAVPVRSQYAQYKKELRQDFYRRCGYCGDWDQLCGGIRVYQIDHFVPRKPKGFKHALPENDYQNLVYSCFYCNNAKRNDFPSNNHEIHNDGSSGYIDPCQKEYCEQFIRNAEGEIVPQTAVGTYMYRRMKLYLRRHAILWRIEQVHALIEELKDLGQEEADRITGGRFSRLLFYHHQYFNQLIELDE